jgi:hypothetical protein
VTKNEQSLLNLGEAGRLFFQGPGLTGLVLFWPGFDSFLTTPAGVALKVAALSPILLSSLNQLLQMPQILPQPPCDCGVHVARTSFLFF